MRPLRKAPAERRRPLDVNSTGFQELVSKAQDGDRRAMDQVLEALRPYLHKIASSYADPVRPVRSTTDLLQDAFLRAWENVDSFQGGEGDEETFALFRGWIAQIVRRVGMNARRNRDALRRSGQKNVLRIGQKGLGEASSVAGSIDPPAAEPSPSSHVRHDERLLRIEEALRKLPRETDAEIVRMHFFDRLALTEVAESLDLKYNYVRDRYRLCMQRLQHALKNLL